MAIFGLTADVEANPDKNVILYVPGKTKLTPQDVFLGGIGTGVDDTQLNGATRVYGNDAAGTRTALSHYEGDLASQIRAAQATNFAPRIDSSIGMPTMARQKMEIDQANSKIGNDQANAQLTGGLYGNPTLSQKTFDHNVSQDAFSNTLDKAKLAEQIRQFGTSSDIDRYNADTNRINSGYEPSGGMSGTGGGASSGQYSSIVNKYADQFGVPASLIDAVIGQESGGQNGLTSSAGAYGIMQLMPETAKGLGVTDSNDPDQNIMGGVKYLSQQLQKYGSGELALAAYNAGPGAVDNAISRAGSSDWDAVSRYLPSETQNYVPSILGKLKSPTSSGLGDPLPAKAKAPTDIEKARAATADAAAAVQGQASSMTRSDFNKAMALIRPTWIRDGVDIKSIQDVIDNAVTKDEIEANQAAASSAANANAYNATKKWWEAPVK